MISAIVLAAGKSLRMGDENKMLLPFKDSTILETVLDHLKQSLIDEIIVVINPDNSTNNIAKDQGKISYVVNEHANQGLTSSIQQGIRTASNNSNAYLICLGDMPTLNTNDYNLLINKYLNSKSKVILVPVYNKKRGNPVLFTSHFRDELLQLKSTNGCKPVALYNSRFLSEIDVTNKSYFTDIDTSDDYSRVSGY